MKDGFFKLGVATPELKVADCSFNTDRIIEKVKAAANEGAVVLAFPELSVTGYTCGDLLFRHTLLNSAEESLVRLMNETSDLDILIFVGLPVSLDAKLYNCAAAVYHGKLLGLIPKTNIPNYGEHYELRYFAPAPDATYEVCYAGQRCMFGTKQIFVNGEMPKLKIAAEICEDVWCQLPVSVGHIKAGANVIINLSASAETVTKPDYRRNMITSYSGREICVYLYSDAGSDESTTDLVFSGHSMIVENGTVLAENKPFGEDKLIFADVDIDKINYSRSILNDFICAYDPSYRYTEFSLPVKETKLTRRFDRHPFIPSDKEKLNENCEFILNMQSTALAKRIKHICAEKAVIGVSGGLDSTLALIVSVLAMKKLGRSASDVKAITMPCFGTGKRTRTNAEILCERLGVEFECVDISATVRSHFNDIGHDEKTYDVAFENAQARERTQVLMDIANSEKGIVVGTGDLSETALGWSTFNGDHMSMYGVNSGIPKTLIRHIVRYCAEASNDEEYRNVLLDILDTPVSPELVPSANKELTQKTEEILGDYDLHDFFLYYFIRAGYTPEKLYRIACMAFDGVFSPDYILKTLKTFIGRFFSQQFKRSCCPDGVKIGTVGLSPRGDWRMPSDAVSYEWLKNI